MLGQRQLLVCPRVVDASQMLLFHQIANAWDENVDRYIALTEFARRKLIEGGLPEDKIIVKPNFVHPDPGPRVADSGYALFVGRLSREKGIGTLLRAWENLPGIPLNVVGDGPLRPQVEEAVARGNHVQTELLGFRSREEVIALMREASLLVFPSECYEGLPTALVEAFACGTPVIGSRIGSVEELIREGVSGLLVEPGDASELASAVQLLWSDPQLRHRLAAGARAQYEAHYTAERNYKLIMKIFEDAITGKT